MNDESSDLPPKTVCNHAARESAKHASNREDAHSNGVELVHRVLMNVLPVPIFIHVLHEVLDVLHKHSNILYDKSVHINCNSSPNDASSGLSKLYDDFYESFPAKHLHAY